jgi:predicted nucleotidyltransferase
MARGPKDPKEIFPDIISDYKELFGDALVSIILYGSATGKDYAPGRSDINFMIVLTEAGMDDLDKAFKVVSKWKKKRVAVPLFLTETYIRTSLDVFPIEYLNFQHHHLLVYGDDILEELTFQPEDIRLQCEREIKGKLLLLRVAYIETNGRGNEVREIIGQSLQAFLAIFEGLLYLKEKEIPVSKTEIIHETCLAYELELGLFEKLLSIREEGIKPSEEELKDIFRSYLKEIRKLSKNVDTMGG